MSPTLSCFGPTRVTVSVVARSMTISEAAAAGGAVSRASAATTSPETIKPRQIACMGFSLPK